MAAARTGANCVHHWAQNGRESFCQNYENAAVFAHRMRNWGSGGSRGGLGLLGQGYADDQDGNVVGRTAAAVSAVLNGSRRVYLQV